MSLPQPWELSPTAYYGAVPPETIAFCLITGSIILVAEYFSYRKHARLVSGPGVNGT